MEKTIQKDFTITRDGKEPCPVVLRFKGTIIGEYTNLGAAAIARDAAQAVLQLMK